MLSDPWHACGLVRECYHGYQGSKMWMSYPTLLYHACQSYIYSCENYLKQSPHFKHCALGKFAVEVYTAVNCTIDTRDPWALMLSCGYDEKLTLAHTAKKVGQRDLNKKPTLEFDLRPD